MSANKIYLVEDTSNYSPGTIIAIFTAREDAERFANSLDRKTHPRWKIKQRSLFYGQPPIRGYNN